MVVLKSATELEKMHRAGLVVWQMLNTLRPLVQPGATTLDLEQEAERRSAEWGARPAFKGYRGFPCVLCTSLNDEIVHGIPSAKRKLKEGDILSIDYGAEVDGYYGDAAVTLPVGRIAPELETLLRVTRESLDRAIDQCRPGRRLGDIGAAVQGLAEQNGLAVVREFVGHGIGTRMHEEPNVPNYGTAGRGLRLQEGMVLALEPMLTTGGSQARVLGDEWTAVTADGSFAAHFEHTVAVTSNGPRILTRPKEMTGPAW